MLRIILIAVAILLIVCSLTFFFVRSHYQGHDSWLSTHHREHHDQRSGPFPSHQPIANTASALPPSPEDPVLSTLIAYCQALTSDASTQAYALLDPSLQQIVTKPIFEGQFHRHLLRHRGLRSCQMLDFIAVFHAGDANAVITLSYGDGSQEKLALALLKHDQVWKVLFVGFFCTFAPGVQDSHEAPCCNVASAQMLFPWPCRISGDTVGAE